MTYCVAMSLDEGMLFASDSRTNAGIDHVSTFCKMHTFEVPGERMLVFLTSGNLGTSQYVVNRLRQGVKAEAERNLHNVISMFDVAEMVGDLLKAAIARAQAGQNATDVDFTKHARGNRLLICVQDIDLGIVDWLSNRHAGER